MTCQALRTICIAYKDFDPNQLTNWREFATPLTIPTNSATSPKRRTPNLLTPASATSSSNLTKQKKFYEMEIGLNCLGIAGMRLASQ